MRAALLVPARRRGNEILDDPDVDPRVVRRSMDDVALANRLFGNVRAILAELRPELQAARDGRLTMLDVGTGAADIPVQAHHAARRDAVELETIGVDTVLTLALAGKPRLGTSVCADARRLPFTDHSIDVVVCSQLLHHFADGDARALLSELDRVARRRVIVSEIRRSWLAAAGIWLASFALRFHPVSRHDGVVSVMRGFTARELRESVRAATGQSLTVRRRLMFRLTASWAPRSA